MVPFVAAATGVVRRDSTAETTDADISPSDTATTSHHNNGDKIF